MLLLLNKVMLLAHVILPLLIHQMKIILDLGTLFLHFVKLKFDRFFVFLVFLFFFFLGFFLMLFLLLKNLLCNLLQFFFVQVHFFFFFFVVYLFGKFSVEAVFGVEGLAQGHIKSVV